MLTKISDEKIEGITSEYEEILELNPDPVRFYIADALLEAQLESCQKEHDGICKAKLSSFDRAWQNYHKEILGLRDKEHQEKVQEIIEEIEKYCKSGQCWLKTPSPFNWQALKDKIFKEVGASSEEEAACDEWNKMITVEM